MHDGERDELIARVADELRAPVTLDVGFDARVMAEVRHPADRWRAAARWWTEPRVRLSPLAGLAWAAALAGVVLLGARALEGPRARAETAAGESALAAEPGTQIVQFVLVAPRAASVALVGDFNDWDPSRTPLRPAATGVWSVNVPLQPGQHQYAYVVDGRDWQPDPAAPRAVADDFGSPNSVITVGGKSS
jgi:predicted carbohydrate-binding protein with CBM48